MKKREIIKRLAQYMSELADSICTELMNENATIRFDAGDEEIVVSNYIV